MHARAVVSAVVTCVVIVIYHFRFDDREVVRYRLKHPMLL